MRFNIMSDIHNEFGQLKDLQGKKEDILLLAGDIGIANVDRTYMPFLESACKQYEQVIMVMGNHEHYNGNFDTSYAVIKDTTKELDNFTLLENEFHVCPDGTVILGCTLWADIDPVHERAISYSMNDYRIVSNLTTTISKHTHKESVRWLIDQLENSKDLSNVIVMTHMSPTMKAAEEYRGSELNSAYGTDLTELILKYQPSVWIHGHTHVSMDYLVGKTPIICNPRGYQGHALNHDFKLNLFVEL